MGWLKRKLKLSEILELGKATLDAPEPEAYPAHLRRMDLDDPQGLREELYQRCWPACGPARKSGAEWRSVENSTWPPASDFTRARDSTR